MKTLLAAAVSTVIATSAHALPTAYDTEVDFLSNAGTVAFESFETSALSSNQSSLSVSGFTMSMSAGDSLSVVNQNNVGGQAHRGRQFVEFNVAANTVTYTFDTAITSFGINITDFGDREYVGDLTFTNDLGAQFVAATQGADGNDQFFGFVSDTAFTQVTFNQPNPDDYYSVDGVYFGGNAPTSVSAPAPFALLGLGLIGLAAVRRRS